MKNNLQLNNIQGNQAGEMADEEMINFYSFGRHNCSPQWHCESGNWSIN